MKIKKSDLISTYAQSVGIETAKELINKKINAAALEEKEHYTEEETAKICGELIKEGGLIRIVAQNFVVQLERKRSEEQALLLDNIETQIWYLTDIETYGAVNKAHAEFLGMEKGILEGESLYDIVGREEVRVCIAGNREVFEKKKQTRTEEWVKNGKEKTRLLSITRTPKIDVNGNVEYVICAAEDITDRKHAEKRIEHLNSVLKAIRDVNQVIIVEKDRNSLLQKACDVLIEARGYDAAWLGFLRDGETFAMVKGSGFMEDFSRFREHLLGGEPPPCFKNALAQKVPFMLVDKSIQCGDCFFKNAHTDKEVAIIRIEHAGRVFGLLTISLASIAAADEEEKGILMEVAGDIGFALHDMEMEEERKRAEKELKHTALSLQEHVEKLEESKKKEAEAYRLREHFLKETSHRIITPVAIIGGHTDLLLKSNNLDEDQKEKIRVIRERNEEVQKLVRDALAENYLMVEKEDGSEK